MVRTIITTTVLAGVLTVGGAGVASAATTGATGSTPAHVPDCAKAPAALARIQRLEGRATTWLPKAQQRLATAQQEGKQARATRIQRRIAFVEKAEVRGTARQQRIDAACPGATPGAGSGVAAG